jgi:TetR/AcrR family transcriptional regulator, acrAB operon repressor
MRRTKEEAEQTKQHIIRSAIKVMNKKGLSSTRFEDIAKEANVTRGAIYHYFKNKSEILYAIHQGHKKRIHEFMDKFTSGDVEPIHGMKQALIETFIQFEKNDEFREVEELFLKIEFASIIKEDKELCNMFSTDREESICRLIEILKQGQESGIIRNDIEIEKLVYSVMSFFVGITSLWSMQYLKFSIADMAKDYVEILYSGILKK